MSIQYYKILDMSNSVQLLAHADTGQCIDIYLVHDI